MSKHPLDEELHYYDAESIDEILLSLIRAWKHLSIEERIILAEYVEYLAHSAKDRKIEGFRLN